MPEKKAYKVLHPIAYDGRKEVGEIVELTDEEAANIGPDYIAGVERDLIEPVEPQPDQGTGEYVPDDEPEQPEQPQEPQQPDQPQEPESQPEENTTGDTGESQTQDGGTTEGQPDQGTGEQTEPVEPQPEGQPSTESGSDTTDTEITE